MMEAFLRVHSHRKAERDKLDVYLPHITDKDRERGMTDK